MNKNSLFVVLLAGFLAGGGFAYEIPSSATPVPIGSSAKILKEFSKGLAPLADYGKKALVFISISKTISASPYGGMGNFMDPFEFFFGDPRYRDPRYRRQEQPKQQQSGLGSGFFIDLKKGYILTNNHVVEGADQINLKLANGESYEAKIIGRDENTDIAVVQVIDEDFNRNNLTSLVLGDSEKLKVASFVMALGAPFGLESSISVGVVSAVGRGSLQIAQMGDFIQTDAAINPGNSGGPLIDMDGKVVGINTAIFSKSGGYNGIGFAVPSKLVRRVATSLINTGHSNRGYLGISFKPLPKEWVESLDLPKNTRGVLVAEIARGGPAEQAGIETGDVIVKVDNKDIVELSDLTNAIGLMSPGTRTEITLYRSGKKKKVDVKIQAWPGTGEVLANKSEASPDSYGLFVTPLNQNLRLQYKVQAKSGLLITKIEPNSPAQRAQLLEGDVILVANGKKVQSRKDLDRILNQGKKIVVFYIERQGNKYWVDLRK